MRKILMLVTLLIMVMSISGCVKKDSPKEVNNTLTCKYETLITKEDETIVFTYRGNTMISIFVNDEELDTEDFFEEYTEVDVFLTDMVDWYTNSGLFEDATCVYNITID